MFGTECDTHGTHEKVGTKKTTANFLQLTISKLKKKFDTGYASIATRDSREKYFDLFRTKCVKFCV